jgi:hypothetical protein
VSDLMFTKPKKEIRAADVAICGHFLKKVIRVIARDRRMAAIHEAGHMVVASRFGFRCQAFILPTPDNDRGEEKMWVGRCSLAGRKPTKQRKRMIAVAGAVAEAYWQDRDIWDVAEEIDWYEPAVMSPTDWHLAGCPVGEPNTRLFTAVGEVAALLRPDGGSLWSPLIQTARNLIVTSRTIRLETPPISTPLTGESWNYRNNQVRG